MVADGDERGMTGTDVEKKINMRQALRLPVQCCGWRKFSTSHTDRQPLARTHRLISVASNPIPRQFSRRATDKSLTALSQYLSR